MDTPALAFSATRTVELVDTPDGVYFVGAAPVRMKFRGGTVHLLLMIPEADVIGDVVRSRNVAIGVTCAVFVIVAALTFAAITLLLAPLHTIAERMQRAADFDDDGEDETVSAMAEVAALQQAYYDMNDELNRIRSFVPQSVLVAKQRQRAYAAGDEEEDDFKGSSVTGKEETETVRSVRSSHRSRQSKHSRGESSAVPAGPVASAFDAALQIRVVAVLVANASEFTTFAGSPPSASTAQRSAEVLTELVQAAELAIGVNGGVLGNFHGDHFTATFNAVRPCSAPPRRACAAALAILQSAPCGTSTNDGLRFRVGIAAGRCLVGNTGTATAKTFSVVGPAFTQANFLERLSKLYGPECRALVTDRVCGDIVTQYRFRYVDHVLLPPRQPTLIAALLGTCEDAADPSNAAAGNANTNKPGAPRDNEWLYVLEAQESADPNGRHNAVFQCLIRRELDECLKVRAAEDTAGVPNSEEQQPGAAALANLIRDYQSQGGTGAAPTTKLADLQEAFLRPRR
jgi:class 3 adenylate cyclase/DnaJ-domain-containing protein 1